MYEGRKGRSVYVVVRTFEVRSYSFKFLRGQGICTKEANKAPSKLTSYAKLKAQ